MNRNMQRFFVDLEDINTENRTIQIKGENVNYIKNVLRYHIGEKIEVVIERLDNKIYECIITELAKDFVCCNITEETEANAESNIYVNLIQALPKSDKMEWIIEKGTELGVKEFTPLRLNRCVVKLDRKEEERKIERWKKIAVSAAEQSKRDMVPMVNHIFHINEMFHFLQNYDIVLLAYEEEKNTHLKNVLKNVHKKPNLKIAIIIGPEGGIEKEEVQILKEKCNAEVVSLGKRILRTETAGMMVAANIMYELEDLGGKV